MTRLFRLVVLVATITATIVPNECRQARLYAQVSPPAQPTNDQVTVTHLTTQVVQDAIERLHGGQTQTSVSATGAQATITLPGPSGQQTQITLDHATKLISLRGPAASVQAWKRLITTMDQAPGNDNEFTQLVPLTHAKPDAVQKAMQLIQFRGTTASAGRGTDAAGGPNGETGIVELAQAGQRPAPDTPPAAPGAGQPAGPNPDIVNALEQEGLLGPVQIEYLEGLDVIVLKGNKRDVERVMAIIAEIEQLSVTTEPAIELLDLEHVDSQAMSDLVTPLYEEVLSSRQGQVSITPLVKPNSILLIGRVDNVRVVTELIRKLDKPVVPGMQFHVFRLKHMNATEAEETITRFYEGTTDDGPTGLATRVHVVSDYRSNSLIVQAGPRDAAEVAKLLSEVDVASGDAVNELKVFRLKNTLAEELAPILEEALRGRSGNQTGGQGFGQQGGGGAGTPQSQPRSAMLTFQTIDAADGRRLQTGVLNDVQVSADTRSNSLIVRGPAESMPLIEALVTQLDDMPAEAAEIKVFPIVNGDSTLLVDVLQQLFGNQQQTGQQQFGNQQQIGVGLAENPLIPIRFSVDERTNSIIAVGSLADLIVVEAVLLRLDEEDIRQRQNIVYRLRYAPAADVSNAINQFLQSERQLQDVAPNQVSPFQQIEREVIVVPEPVSNSLIVSATPRYFKEISKIVEDLDARPPMVMIQVLIAEVSLSGFMELGMEFGLQQPLLFDRSVITDALAVPGFNFNNTSLGNSGSAASLATRANVGTQGLSSFGVGRSNGQQGFGGFVFSASSDSVSVLVRALQNEQRLQVLSRPQIMTMDNQPAFVQVGARVPRITSTQLTQLGTINNTVLENVGILLGVTPRISPDGIVVMEIDAEKSELGPIDDGIPISINTNGDVIRSPIINTTTAQTTVSARNGQTVVLGGLISETDSSIRRGIPLLSDIPILGKLFGYEQQSNERTELLIIMTPFVVRGDHDVSFLNQMETERMSWCLADVYRVHGAFDAMPRETILDETAVPELRPDQDPSATDFRQSQNAKGAKDPSEMRLGAQIETVSANEVVPVLPPRNVAGVAARQIIWQSGAGVTATANERVVQRPSATALPSGLPPTSYETTGPISPATATELAPNASPDGADTLPGTTTTPDATPLRRLPLPKK